MHNIFQTINCVLVDQWPAQLICIIRKLGTYELWFAKHLCRLVFVEKMVHFIFVSQIHCIPGMLTFTSVWWHTKQTYKSWWVHSWNSFVVLAHNTVCWHRKRRVRYHMPNYSWLRWAHNIWHLSYVLGCVLVLFSLWFAHLFWWIWMWKCNNCWFKEVTRNHMFFWMNSNILRVVTLKH